MGKGLRERSEGVIEGGNEEEEEAGGISKDTSYVQLSAAVDVRCDVQTNASMVVYGIYT